MAVLINKSNEALKVVLRRDDAIPEDITDEVFEQYKKTLDESLLKLTKEPTRFVLRKQLPFGAQQSIANHQIAIGVGGKPTFQFGYMLEEIRCALMDIENPAYLTEDDKLTFKKAEDGFAAFELIAMLNTAGVVAELFATRQERLAASPAKK